MKWGLGPREVALQTRDRPPESAGCGGDRPRHPHQMEISLYRLRPKFSDFSNKPSAEKEPPDSVLLPAILQGITDEKPELGA